jgi:hypothetical protein
VTSLTRTTSTSAAGTSSLRARSATAVWTAGKAAEPVGAEPPGTGDEDGFNGLAVNDGSEDMDATVPASGAGSSAAHAAVGTTSSSSSRARMLLMTQV